MIEIIDDFLDKEEFDNIYNIITSAYFPWFYNTEKVYSGDGEYQFTHIFYVDHKPHSPDYEVYIEPIVKKLNASSIFRIKANLTTKRNEVYGSGMHIDVKGYTTGILYITDTDGPTRFKTGEEIECKPNRMVLFDSNLEHEGCYHTTDGPRIVINFNFYRGT